MKYRKLAGTDLEVSVLCFGPMRSAATEPGEDAKSRTGEEALRVALDLGINFLHSSFEYRTRWMMSRVLRDHPKRQGLHHVIKVPVPDFKDGGRFDAAKFRLRVEEALRDLHADRIDVLQWMWRSEPNSDELRVPMLDEIADPLGEAFQKMRKEGKVGWLFTFPYTPAAGMAALKTGQFDGLIAYYNPAEMEMFELLQELDRRGNKGFLPIRPLFEGILTDARDPNRMKSGDRFKDPKYENALKIRSKIAAAFEAEIGDSMTNFALRFGLAHPKVASLILGLNSRTQVESAVAGVELPDLDKEVVRKAWELWKNF